jgi:biotin-dependent carboxylase-like uncharacterized protein
MLKMPGRLRVLRAGPGTTIQDHGRYGYLRYGVTPAGPMDWVAYRTANLALGNDAQAAAIEVSVGGIETVCEGAPFAVAFAGARFLWRRDGVVLPAAARLILGTGETLSAQAGDYGAFAYLAVGGGLDTPVTMGSRATHTRSGIGGIDGRMLRAGDMLPAACGRQYEASFEAVIEAPWLGREPNPFRVVLGPQDDYFTKEALRTFFAGEFTLTPMADRMAYRFDGPEIAHARGYDIVSDGVALGAVQIAGDKKPLILMADRQPTGGYPKLGHVARDDIGRLAQMRPGESCRFRQVSATEARMALLAREAEVAGTPHCLHLLRRIPTSRNLFEANLIDGVVDPLAGERTEGKF